MREALGDLSCIKYAFVPNASGDHAISIFDLSWVDFINLFAAFLTDPAGRAVVVNNLLNI